MTDRSGAAGKKPVPVTGILRFPRLVTIVTEPGKVPAPVGAKTIPKFADCEARRVRGKVGTSETENPVPLTEIPVTVTIPPPVFFTEAVVFTAGLPTLTVPKSKEVGDGTTVGGTTPELVAKGRNKTPVLTLSPVPGPAPDGPEGEPQ